jgi:hypothetical protein
MGFRHDIAKSLIALIVRHSDDIEYRDIAESNMADWTTATPAGRSGRNSAKNDGAKI